MVIPAKTVFVLGAGASHAYGFPTGPELMDKIARTCAASPPQEICIASGASVHRIKLFGERLLESGVASVDEFVRDDRSFATIAKFAIAWHLLRAERLAGVSPDHKKFHPEDDWAGYLLRAVFAEGVDALAEYRIATFNFDRSFERRLLATLMGRFGYTMDEAAVLATNLPIEHLSGTLGSPGWAGPPTVKTVDWGEEATTAALARSAPQINFVHEPRADGPLTIAREWICHARLVCYLGFSFHPTNLEAIRPLTIADPVNTRNIATGFGLTPAEAREIEARFRRGEKHGTVDVWEGKKSLELLRGHMNLHGSMGSHPVRGWQ